MASIYERTDIYDLFESEKKYLATKKHWETVLSGKFPPRIQKQEQYAKTAEDDSFDRGRDIDCDKRLTEDGLSVGTQHPGEGRPLGAGYSALDVSIGTGSLTLPLAELGFFLCGSDLSSSMLSKCAENARSKGLEVRLLECDFRRLNEAFKSESAYPSSFFPGDHSSNHSSNHSGDHSGDKDPKESAHQEDHNARRKYDLVMSTGNSLAYVGNEELLNVLEQMDALVSEGGYLYFDLRNWDKILEEKNRFYLYNPVFRINPEDGKEECIHLTQVWDYHEDGRITFHLLYTFETDRKITRKEVFEETYHPIRQRLLIDKLDRLGYNKIEIGRLPAQFGAFDIKKDDWYYLIARK